MMARLIAAMHPQFRPNDIVDAARNIVLFAGWGLVWMATAPPQRAWRSIGRATATGAAISITVELCQVASSNRYASILDVLTNTTGSFVGAFFFAALVRTVGAIASGSPTSACRRRSWPAPTDRGPASRR